MIARAALAIALLGVLPAGCTRPGKPGETRSDPPVVSASAPPPASSGPRSSHRAHGGIEGRFVVAGATFVVGEPIVATFELRPVKGPLRVFVGGDSRNSAAYPTRVAVQAVDVANGAVVCDNVASPLPSFGGIGSEQDFAQGEWLRETFVLNPGCPGLGKPGRVRVTMHRRVTNLDLKVQKPGAKYPTSCDVHPIHEGPARVPGAPECEKLLDALPWVTSTVELELLPFDAVALRRAVERTLVTASDEMTRQRVALWLCGWVGCACPKQSTPSNADLLAALPETLPPSFPRPCP